VARNELQAHLARRPAQPRIALARALPDAGHFDGEHSFVIEAASGGCRLHHEESFGGILVPLFGKMLADTERGFVALNEALKQRVEARA